MPRSRALFTAPIVLAIVIAGVFAIRSRDNDNSDLNTTRSRTCPPVARADVASTRPATPLPIDVLANDSDADGDPLVFQIIKTTGGESTVDDGGTPTDASDDRVLFTPADPAPENATIEYQAVDPDGEVDQATVTVSINAEGALPAGAQSEPVTEGSEEASSDCGGNTTTTEADSTGVSTPPLTGSVTGTTVDGDERRSRRDRDRDDDEGRRRTTRTTRRDAADDDRPTTTRRPSAPDPTDPPATNPPPTDPPPTSPPPTEPPGPEPTTPPECGPFPSDGTDEQQDAWKQCVRDGGG